MGNDNEKTLVLRRYILGLSLVAFTAHASTYLRQGCNLVPSGTARQFQLVHSDGKRDSQELSKSDALKFATAAANAFGVASGIKEVLFDPKLAQMDLKDEADGKGKSKRASRKSESTSVAQEDIG